ncbi:MAG: DUF397 domain-containing protein [Actinophytocola sp.]|uniref:DUF397 domain-containing protein n=1 Tax=Actinophytocola sp. TaxID=1872138 RepID=UPI001321B1F6|nr:DUF397 domain-containing protein [Actinophytocola sp.]MPZ82072.1 DUF397 domain-containing protein [Actinophytocola sp.]
MRQEPLRFKKSRRSAGQSACVEVAHTLRHIRDSKNPAGSFLHGVDVTALIAALRIPPTG